MLYTIDEVAYFFRKRDQLGIKPGLDRVHFLLEKLGSPEKKLKTVHVAGTNGKGSTIQFIQAALRENNYRVGVFTSPSFIGLRGHFLINDIPATEEAVIELVNQLMPAIKELDLLDDAPTTFEIITVMAFVYFVHQIDIAIIETGMGGRFDTTNCFKPEVAVITNVSMDHMRFLGGTLTDIAWHKAGIIKESIPVVLGRIDEEESVAVFEKESVEKQACLYQLGKTFDYTTSINQVLTWQDNDHGKSTFDIQMKGQHQADNAAVAYKVLHILKEKGFKLQLEKVNQGMNAAVLPGRFEIVQQHPVIIIDSAHNVAGINAFLTTLDQAYPNQRKVLLFAGFQDKQLDAMLQVLNRSIDELMLTTFDHSRAASLAFLENIPVNIRKTMVPDWKTALKSFIKEKETVQTVYCVTGSLHFITEVRRFIKAEKTPNL